MNARTPHTGTVVERTPLDEHLVRIALGDLEGPGGAAGFASSGVPDEWVGLVVPGQFQSRYYTVRSLREGLLSLDVVVHDEGLVTEWAQTDCVGDEVGLGAPKGSYLPPADATWVLLAGDLTALPAMARIREESTLPVVVHAEVPGAPMPAYFGDSASGPITWHHAEFGTSALADVVRDVAWPDGPGYFWMSGESSQMREIRRHLRHDLGRDTKHYNVMGYWSGSRGRARRAVDPGPIYARGKARGLSDEQIWAEYDAARDA